MTEEYFWIDPTVVFHEELDELTGDEVVTFSFSMPMRLMGQFFHTVSDPYFQDSFARQLTEQIKMTVEAEEFLDGDIEPPVAQWAREMGSK